MKKVIGLVVVLAIVAAGGWYFYSRQQEGPAVSAEAAKIVKERREDMKKLGGQMKAIKEALEAGDIGKVADSAKTISDIAEMIPNLFPEGTSMDQVKDPETGAKPIIWEKRDEFEEAARNLASKADTLAGTVAGGDVAAVAAAFDAMGKEGCGGCHKTFRQKLD